MKQAVILLGNYGSGKTQIALNLAMYYAQKGKTVLVDMDVVNPYFRSSDYYKTLEEKGIKLIKPIYANTQVDLPSISAEVYSAFNYEYAVFDGGGDPVGATVFGSIADKFKAENAFFAYVVNVKRPLQQDSEHIINMMNEIENAAGIKINGFINNTNLAKETTVEDVYTGDKILNEVSEKTGIKIAAAVAVEEIAEQLNDLKYPVFTIKTYIKLPWSDVD